MVTNKDSQFTASTYVCDLAHKRLHEGVPTAQDMKHTREHGLAVVLVSITDRKGVVNWFEGRASNVFGINVPIVGDLSFTRGPMPGFNVA